MSVCRQVCIFHWNYEQSQHFASGFQCGCITDWSLWLHDWDISNQFHSNCQSQATTWLGNFSLGIEIWLLFFYFWRLIGGTVDKSETWTYYRISFWAINCGRFAQQKLKNLALQVHREFMTNSCSSFCFDWKWLCRSDLALSLFTVWSLLFFTIQEIKDILAEITWFIHRFVYALYL